MNPQLNARILAAQGRLVETRTRFLRMHSCPPPENEMWARFFYRSNFLATEEDLAAFLLELSALEVAVARFAALSAEKAARRGLNRLELVVWCRRSSRRSNFKRSR